MPSYFVDNGVKMTMTNDMFDMLWNSIGNDEFISSETSDTSSEEEPKTKNAEWRKQDNGYYNRKPNDDNYFKTYYKEKTKHSCVCDICGSQLSCKSNLAKHKKSKKCLVAGNATAPCQKHLV